MATQQLMASLPQLHMEAGFIIALEAIDPATGNAVAGVRISTGTVYGEADQGGTPVELHPGEWAFVAGPDG